MFILSKLFGQNGFMVRGRQSLCACQHYTHVAVGLQKPALHAAHSKIRSSSCQYLHRVNSEGRPFPLGGRAWANERDMCRLVHASNFTPRRGAAYPKAWGRLPQGVGQATPRRGAVLPKDVGQLTQRRWAVLPKDVG